MSKKQLNTENVLSELTGQSAFFQKLPTPSSLENSPETPKRELDRPVERSTERPNDRSSERFVESPSHHQRITRRYSFEAFDDQVRKLKTISMQAGINGDNLSISEMIREAIDGFLKQRTTE